MILKKVLFVATVVREHINVFHVPFLKMFKELGWETSVAARNDYFTNPNDCIIPFCDNYYDICFERNPFKLGNVTAYYDLKALIEKGDFDIIHCHTPVGGALTRLAARNARKKGSTVIYTAHGFHFFKGASLINWMLYYPMENFLSRYTDKIITINFEDYKIAKHFHSPHTYYVNGVGIDPDVFCTNENTEQSVRKELGISENTCIIISVGELIKRKNYITIFKALERIKDKDFLCLICGQGVLENQLIDYVKKSNLSTKVKFLGFRRDIPRLLHGSQIFVFPSLQEGLPVAVMEAMGSEKPIVASDIRGTNDLVKDNVNGYLLAPNDIDGFASKISYLIENPSIANSMGKKSREMIKPYYIDEVIEEMKNIYFSE